MRGASPAPSESRRARLDRALAGQANDLLTPFLVIDLGAVEHNARAMVHRLGERSDRWRPHIKTVKQSRVLRALLEVGIRHFKCATLDELWLLLDCASEHGPQTAIDVLWAYPPHESSLRALVARWEARPDRDRHRVAVLADHAEHLRWLDARVPPGIFGVMPDVDLGMGRTGRPPAHWREHFEPPSRLRLCGLHGYDGHHRWDARAAAHAGYAELVELAAVVRQRASSIGSRNFESAARFDLVTSGTHSFEHALAFDFGPTVRHQVSPGTIVLSDLRSAPAAEALGLEQAAFVATRVISRRPDRITVDAGSKAISPDGAPPSCAVLGHERLQPQTPSEEHLPVNCDPTVGSPPAFGTMLYLVPSHVCTTVNLHRQAVYVRGDTFVGIGDIEAAGHPLQIAGGPA